MATPGNMLNSEDESLSIWISERMRRAGFNSTHATIQAAMASVLQGIARYLLQLENLHVFGSYADGWGSCLTRLDGRVDADSDIDVTVIRDRKPVHFHDHELCETKCQANDCPAEYTDGHLKSSLKAKMPNYVLDRRRSGISCAVDLILAHAVCNYPRIELLEKGYKSRSGQDSHIPSHIIELLIKEVRQSPRCHAVAASPPNLPAGSCMRVSTTLLERCVMRNLNSIQGQFFIIIKFLIKKVVSSRVTGLKTYMAKNLLFYMLDETPAEDWRPENLLALVRISLLTLVDMMESSESEDVCMKHFFLRDANVYFKKGHDTKEDIVKVVRDIVAGLPIEVSRFVETLPESEVNAVHFYVFFPAIAASELGSSRNYTEFLLGFASVDHAYAAVNCSQTITEDDLSNAILKISSIPECAEVSRESLMIMASHRFGRPLRDLVGEVVFDVNKGFCCTNSDDEDLSLVEAEENVWKILQSVKALNLKVSNRRVVKLQFPEELTSLAVSLSTLLNEDAIHTSESLFSTLLKNNILLQTVFEHRSIERLRFRFELNKLMKHFRHVLGNNGSTAGRSSNYNGSGEATEPGASGGETQPLREEDLD